MTQEKYSGLVSLKKDAPAWKVLASPDAPIIMYCLKSLFENHQGTVTLEGAIDHLAKSYKLKNKKTNNNFKKAKAELAKWVNSELIIEENGNLLPTNSLFTAIDFLNSLKSSSESQRYVKDKPPFSVFTDTSFIGVQSSSGVEEESIKGFIHLPPKKSLYAAYDSSNPIVSWFIILMIANKSIDEFYMDGNTINYLKENLPHQFQYHFTEEDASEKTLKKAAIEYTQTHSRPNLIDEDPFLQNTEYLAECLKLDEVELDILRTLFLISHNNALEDVVDWYLPDHTDFRAHKLLSILTTYPVNIIEHKLRFSGRLLRSHLVQQPHRSRRGSPLYETDRRLTHAIMQKHSNREGILREILKQPSPPSITADDISHLREITKYISRLICNASKNLIRGTNVLLWGPPGTGKTQLALYLGHSLGLTTFEVPNTGEDDDNITEKNRFSQYQLCQSILENTTKSVLIFDEVEDLLVKFRHREGLTKATLNRALEENSIPAIWICNSVESADQAYLRRFDLIVELGKPSLPVKRNMAKKTLGSLSINNNLLDTILKRQEVGPALLTKIRKVAEVCEVSGSAETDALALNVVNGDLAASGSPEIHFTHKNSGSNYPSLEYDPEMINTDVDISKITKHLKSHSELRIFLYGPPGTGKTAWATHLADTLSTTTLVKTPSQIKGMYVGQSEKAIASAFKTASRTNAVLVFDEVDSFLRSRQLANFGHEEDLVNQFLISLEAYDGIVVCTTNFIDNVDTAAQRRFDYKIKFDYLTEKQTNTMFKRLAKAYGLKTSKTALSSKSLTLPGNLLAPGDFAAVLRKTRYYAADVSIEDLHTNLIKEAEFRNPDLLKSKVGFI